MHWEARKLGPSRVCRKEPREGWEPQSSWEKSNRLKALDSNTIEHRRLPGLGVGSLRPEVASSHCAVGPPRWKARQSTSWEAAFYAFFFLK